MVMMVAEVAIMIITIAREFLFRKYTTLNRVPVLRHCVPFVVAFRGIVSRAALTIVGAGIVVTGAALLLVVVFVLIFWVLLVAAVEDLPEHWGQAAQNFAYHEHVLCQCTFLTSEHQPMH